MLILKCVDVGAKRKCVKNVLMPTDASIAQRLFATNIARVCVPLKNKEFLLFFFFVLITSK
jgi:hypothetical protein